MARLQILELPEGSNDERAPFVLVVDQLPDDEVGAAAIRRDLGSGDIPALIGARAVLAFEGSIEIPADDPSTSTDEAFKSEVQHWATGTNNLIADLIDAVNGKKPRRRNDGQRLADERTDIARDMDRLAKRKNELLDALGMDRTGGWDDIVTNARAFRALHEAEDAAIDRIRDLPEQPLAAGAEYEHPNAYRLGYCHAVREAKRVSRPVSVQTAQGPRPGKVIGGQGTADV